AGAVYFTTTAWTTMSGSTQKLVVAGGLLLFAALTHGAGVVLGKDDGLRSAARVLSLVAMALVPAASAVAGLLFAANPVLALLAAAAAAASGHVFLLALVRREGAAMPRAAPWLYDALVFSGVFAGELLSVRLSVSCAAAAVPLLAAWLQRRAHRAPGTVPAAAVCATLATALAALACAVGVAIAHGPPFAVAVAPLGIVVAAAALAAVVLESARAERAPASLTAAVAVAASAVLMATGDLRCVMVAAWCAAATGLQASLRLDRARLLMPALVLSAVGYLFLPAPIRELAMRLRAEAASQLGYEPQRLPLSFYGITFLPYLAGLALLCLWFRRSERGRHRRVSSAWAVSFAAGLAAISLLLGRDLRAPMAVLPADGLLLVLLGYLGQSAAAVLAGCLGVLGGLVCALLWFEVPSGVAAAVGAGATMVLLFLARGPTPHGTFAARTQASYLQAATLAVVALACSTLSCAWPPEQQSAWNLLHAAVLVPMLMLLRSTNSPLANVSRHSPIVPAMLFLPVLWAITTGVAMALEGLGGSPARVLMPAALAMVTFAVHGLVRPASSDALRRERSLVVLGMFALHVLVVPDLIAGYRSQTFLVETFVGTGALAVTAGLLAKRVRLDGLLAVAVVEGAYPLHLIPSAWFGETSGPLGLLGPAVLVLAAALLGARRQVVAATASGMATFAAVLLLGMRLAALPAVPSTRDALASLVIAVLLAVVSVLRARRLLPSSRSADQSWIAVGGLVAVTGPISLLDLLVSGLQWYATGMLVLAVLVFGAAARWRSFALPLSVYGLLQVTLAIVLLFCWQPFGENAHHWRLGSFAAAVVVALACRPRALRTIATLAMAAAGFGMLVVEPLELLWLPQRWWSVLVLGWCAVGLGLSALPRWRSRALGVRIYALPTVVAAALTLTLWSAVMAVEQAPRTAGDLEVLDANAVVFLAAAVALAAHCGARWRSHVTWTAVTIVAFATTPINGLLHGNRSIGLRPDAEAALLAIAIAAGGRMHARGASWALALVAVVLTALQLQDVSTPVTMTLLAGVPLALMLRRLPGAHAVAHGMLLVLAAWSWIAFALFGLTAVRLGPWLGLSAALLGLVCGPWLRLLGAAVVPGQMAALRALAWIAALGALLATCASVSTDMPRLDLLAALSASAAVAFGSMRAARAPEQAPLVQLALAAVLTAYLMLAAGTDLLAVMNGRHHHALTVLGATLFVAAGHGQAPVRRQMRGAAVVAPLLAAALATGLGGLTFALFAGALVMGLGAVVARTRWLGALALMLANSGLFHLWLQQGVFDPSFYGVPAGLSLVFGAELARRPLGAARVMALRITGLAVAYGSVLLQVAQVSVPLHALVLFALAMAAVAWGALRRQAAILVTGVTAVVLDVVVYLAQRGFEQDFLGSVLLVGAGGALFVVAARAARRRASSVPPAG
ncbi:MAG: hypothetical protein ABIP94_13860, partial [Planctomycetota bacterium]